MVPPGGWSLVDNKRNTHAMQMEANVMECLGDWESWGSGQLTE